MAKDESLAAASAVVKTIISRVPGIAEALAGVEAYRREQRDKASREFEESLAVRLEALGDRFNPDWLSTEDGQMFAGKVLESGLDAQMADKRQLFVNALANGATSDADVYEKTKFVDLLRHLSRDALDVLCELHKQYGPIVKQPASSRSKSTFLSSDRVGRELSYVLSWDPYRIESAYRELCSMGIFSGITQWVPDGSGGSTATGSHPSGECYTEFSERFVEFITDDADHE